MHFKDLKAYELIQEQQLQDIRSQGYILRHKKSGAKVCLISNDDDNKVFYIGFKTPPKDQTGVPHIIEHTVLCGSEKFPVKDPFVELCKSSLNTFLNAMTYPDKTIYPVASYNKKDFENLMDVYLDAVFHPNILKHEEIFKQEGWHYELEDIDSPITINGVVYNEMKGAYSSPDEILQTKIMEVLFPHNAYGQDSGGNPEYIPQLTYEEYIDFYKKLYHPSNAYIYLYGDMDMEERLEWMDKNYLSEFTAAEVDSQIALEPAFDAVKDVTAKYPIASEESEEDNTYFAYSKVVDTILNKELYQAFDVLDYALVSAPGAPVRQALIDAGIGQDVYGGFDSYIYQPIFNIYAKNADACDKEAFVSIIEDTLEKVVKEGISENALLAGINSQEFRFREADFGQFPKGLLYGIQCLETWIFDDKEPFLNLECLDTFEFLKKQIGTGYYERLVQEYLLNNTHGAVISIEPEKGLNVRQEEALAKKLQDYKNSLSEEELLDLVEETKRLKAYQEEPSRKEDMLKLPMLSREDMKREAMPFSNIEEKVKNVPVVRHDIFSNGIDYITLMFDAKDIAAEDIPYLGFLRGVLGLVDTASYTYGELSNAVNIYTGGINCGFSVYPNVIEDDETDVQFEIRIKVLKSQLQKAFELVDEIIYTSKIEDTKRLAELVAQSKSRLQAMLSNSGHMVAAIRSMSYGSLYGYYQDATSGIAYYDAICQMDAQMKKEPSVIVAKLKEIIEKIFVSSRLLISFTADTECYENAVCVLEKFAEKLPLGKKAAGGISYEPQKKNEGFTDASAIQYVARSGNFIKNGYCYNGTLRLLKMILSYDYLWQNVRVMGGAYGCMSSFGRTGESYFVSYRDPNLSKTNEVYEGVPEYLKNFHADERNMTKYIIGTFGALDTPLNPEGKGSRSMTAYLQKLSVADVQKERDEILNATDEDIRALAPLIEAVLSDANFCVVGNENNIHNEKDMFLNIRKLNE